MRKIDEIILHCTATPEGREVTVAEIDSWHRQRGFDGIGYHYIVHLDGTVEAGRPLAEVGAHCKGHNSRSIGIAYVGGCDRAGNPKDTRTDAQRKSLRLIVSHFLDYYPGATVHGHREFADKACPCFDVQREFANAHAGDRQTDIFQYLNDICNGKTPNT